MKSSRTPSNRGRPKQRHDAGKPSSKQNRHQHQQRKKEEDVLIEFMPHLRSGNTDALMIHKSFGDDADVFVEKAREFLALLQKEDEYPNNNKNHNDTHNHNNNNHNSSSSSSGSGRRNHDAQEKVKEDQKEGTRNNVTQPGTNMTIISHLANQFHEAATVTVTPVHLQQQEQKQRQQKQQQQQHYDSGTSKDIPHSNPSVVQKTHEVEIMSIQDTMKNPSNNSSSSTDDDMHLTRVSTDSNATNTAAVAAAAFAGGATTTTTMTIPQEPKQTAETGVPTTVSVKWQPKRLYTRWTDQPGKVLASSNNIKHSSLSNMPPLDTNVLILPPKTEITACWQLPLDYIRKRTLEISLIRKKLGDESVKDVHQWTIQDALSTLSVGLFRRGCSENGSNHAIIAKQIVAPTTTTTTTTSSDATRNSLYQAKQALEDLEAHGNVPKNASHNEHDKNVSNESYSYQVNHQLGIIHGIVPFFTPRTPGNVVFRLYFEDDPMYTLATSQCITVRITPNTLEQTLRFILSNFKNKKGSGVSLSSIYSLTSVLEQYKYCHSSKQGRYSNVNQMDSAGRAAWGGICEARKILDAAKVDYMKKCQKLEILEQELHELEQVDDDEEEKTQTSFSTGHASGDEHQTADNSNTTNALQQMRKEYHMEKNLNERKWRETQVSFASLLKSIVKDKNMKFLLKLDIIKKIDLEYQLWCPICESFAPNPFENMVVDEKLGNVIQLQYPYPIKAEHFEACRKRKKEMQQKMCAFTVTDISNTYNIMNSSLFNSLSSAMVRRFQQDCQSPDSSVLMEKKKHAQAMTQKAVELCHAFAYGTQVVVFGSSANGFGSPHSDLDMCLEMPPGVEWSDEETITAMSSLAEKLTDVGMKDVDSSRLTARIPVIKFHVPVGDSLIECDISKANPLACLNTRLLRSYASISPSVRILASVIKRWAKCRNMNDPSQHTLSSYGYILMLLHFLTTHTQCGESLKSICTSDDDDDDDDKQVEKNELPLLPNLQWVSAVPAMSNLKVGDHVGIMTSQSITPLLFQVVQEKPRVLMRHPTQEDYMVNSYFIDITKDVDVLKSLQDYTNRSLPVSSLGYVLLGFFHYYAFVFDYKNHVVSLNAATRNRSHVHRESKAEWDGWRMMNGSSLSIEDPFEEFYDVAHVLKPLNFQILKREFALAYSKMRDAMNQQVEDGEGLLEFLCQDVDKY